MEAGRRYGWEQALEVSPALLLHRRMNSVGP